MQWPPTAMPGRWMWLYGWELLASITWMTSIPCVAGEPRELVGEADVDVAVGRLGELGQLAASAVPRSQTPLAAVRSGRSSKSSTAS